MDSAAVLFGRFGAALALGLLVGLQREYAKGDERDDLFAGTRTFALIGLAGALAAYAEAVLDSPLVFGAALLILGAFIVTAYIVAAQDGDIGQTTEMAAFIVFLAGALCAWGELALGTAVGVATTALLALKPAAQRLVERIDREDVMATLKFAVISALILPVLPDQTYGPPPFDAVSPFKVWLMVVFISGLSFLGYVLIQVVGAKRGVGLTGLLGGLVSSTAVTLTLSERSRKAEAMSRPLALGILLAWIIMFGRVLVEVGVVNRGLLPETWLPITAAAVAGLAWVAFLFFRERPSGDSDPQSFSNPFELKSAIQFGLLYGVILIVAKAASMYLGTAGVYASALVSGVADVDAITLSMAELSRGDSLDDVTAARAIVLAAVSNTLVKGGIVVSVGGAGLRKAILPGVALIVTTALAVAFLGGTG